MPDNSTRSTIGVPRAVRLSYFFGQQGLGKVFKASILWHVIIYVMRGFQGRHERKVSPLHFRPRHTSPSASRRPTSLRADAHFQRFLMRYSQPHSFVTSALLLAALCVIPAASSARLLPTSNITSLYVSVNGSDTEDCTTAPCATLKYAVEAVAAFMVPLDEPVPILLTGGIYSASSCSIVSSRPLNISGAGKDDTVIDCEGSDRLLATSTSLWASFFTVLNGNSTGDGGGILVSLGGVVASTVSLVDLIVQNCTSQVNGGGIAIESGTSPSRFPATSITLLLADLEVNGNAAENGFGGGVAIQGTNSSVWNVTITGSLITGNVARLSLFDVLSESNPGGELHAILFIHTKLWHDYLARTPEFYRWRAVL